MTSRPAASSLQPDDHLTLLARLSVWPLVVLSGIFGPMLYLLPGDTARIWAWPIQPPLSAVILAAGYIFGAVAFATLLLRNQWHALGTALGAGGTGEAGPAGCPGADRGPPARGPCRSDVGRGCSRQHRDRRGPRRPWPDSLAA